jgi:peptide/nickel transport system permease protein
VATFIARRIVLSIPVLVLASVFVFFGVSSVGEPLGELKRRPGVSQETIQTIIDAKHLEDPIVVRYGYWVREAVTDAFGTTLYDRPIWPDLKRALGFTLQMVIAAEILALIIGVSIGVVSARRQYTAFDYAATTFSFMGYSIPIFWFALILQIIFVSIYTATDTRIFFTSGLSSPNPSNFFIDRLQHLALPVAALCYLNLALYSRYMRSSMLEVINSDYVRTARAKGLTEGSVMRRHALRNAMIPIVTIAAINFGALFGGAIVTETIFAIPGMGSFFIRALNARDAYSLMAFLMVTAVFVIVFNAVADILYGILDPRIRYD